MMFKSTTAMTTSPRYRINRTMVSIGLFGVLLLSGCATTVGTEAATTVSSDRAPDDLALVLDSGEDAPTRELKLRPINVPDDHALPEVWDFTAVSLDDGRELDGIDLGTGPAIIGFVTPWCPICKAEAPDIAEAAGKNPDINYVLVHASGSSAEYRRFIDEGGLDIANIANLDDSTSDLWQRFSVVSQPTYVLVDRDGLMRSSVGQLEHDGLVRAADLVTAGF